MAAIFKTFREQQRMGSPGPYSFQRITSNATDTLPGDGFGNPTRPCGLIHSAFRPSDDACIYPSSSLQSIRCCVTEAMAEIYESVFPIILYE